jgi:serine/threonine-protein kinase RsbW
MHIMKYKIESCLEKGTALIKELMEAWEQAGLDESTVFALRLALDEALDNAIKHGNSGNKDLPVEVTCRISPDSIELSVKDSGQGFDYDCVDDPTLKENIPKPNGRGIFLMRNFMDRVEFLENGKLLKMVKLTD